MTKGTKKNRSQSAMVRIYTLPRLLLHGEVVLTEVGFEICSFSFNLSVVPVYAFVLESIIFFIAISELFFPHVENIQFYQSINTVQIMKIKKLKRSQAWWYIPI